MKQKNHLHPDRLLPPGGAPLDVARTLYNGVCDLPIISPHGHTDPSWFAQNKAFSKPAQLLITPDHYLLRLLRSQGRSFDALGVPAHDDRHGAVDDRAIWRLFCKDYALFSGTPSHLWLMHSLHQFFGIDAPLSEATADATYDRIAEALATPQMRPLAILDRANVEVIATTEYATDPLLHHQVLQEKGLTSRIRTTYRPDDVTDPENPSFTSNMARFGALTGEDVHTWKGMIAAHATRRAEFRTFGATATDHGVPSAKTFDLSMPQKQALLDKALKQTISPQEAEAFRGQMLTEMAALSVEDGMVMQIHAGSFRNHDAALFASRGPNLGADMPMRTDFVQGLHPLLNRFGNEPRFRLILFTLDESNYARELAPLAGYWPALRIGPPWWFHDSPQGMRRYFDAVVETAGFANLAGFNDDTRALLSISSRHDVWRREVSRFLAGLVCERQMSEESAADIAIHLCYTAAKKAYNL